MYKLVAIDLDGTLLDSRKMISDENKEAIKNAINAGVNILICSGRIYAGAKIFGKEVGTRLPVITCNGARIKDMDTDEVIYSKSLNLETCRSIVDVCHDMGIYYHVYLGDTMFTEQLAHSSLFYWKKNKELPIESRVSIEVVDDIQYYLEKYPDDISKVIVISDVPEELSKTRKELQKVKGIEIMSSYYNNIEIMTQGVSKGKALKFMAERYGIKQEEVIAMGDNENDLSMIEYAGLGVAMANGEDYVKEAADFVTLSNDDNGVAYAINKFVLNK